MSEQPNPRYYINASPGLRYSLLKAWTTSEVVVAILSLFAFLVLLESVSVWLALSGGALLVGLNMPALYGHMWYDLGLFLQGGYIRFVLGGKLWVNPAHDDSSAVVRWLRQKRYRRAEKRYVFPIRPAVVAARGSQYGIIQQVDRPFDHIPVRGHNSDYSSLDSYAQDYASMTLAHNIDRVSMQAREQWGLKIGISQARLNRPMNEMRISEYFAANGQPLVFAHEQFDMPPEMRVVMQGLRDSADQIIPTMQRYGVVDSWQLLMPTVKRTREMKKAVNNKLDEESLYDLRLVQMGRMTVQAIDDCGMNVRNVHCLSYIELCQLICAGWNVRDLSFLNYPVDWEIEVVTQDDVDDPTSHYVAGDLGTVKEPFPVYPTQEIRVYSDCICMDGNWISSFMLTRQPEQFHNSDVQRAYHDESPAGVWSSMASAGETISGAIQTNMLVYGQRLGNAVGSWWNPDPDIEHPKKRRKRQALQSETEVLSMASLAQRFNDVGTVVAPTREAMVRNRSTVMASLQNRGYKCRLVRRSALQMAAAITGIYGINRL